MSGLLIPGLNELNDKTRVIFASLTVGDCLDSVGPTVVGDSFLLELKFKKLLKSPKGSYLPLFRLGVDVFRGREVSGVGLELGAANDAKRFGAF